VLEWNTPFGPPTRAWLVRPVDGPPAFGTGVSTSRSATLTALDPDLKASAIVCMMTTFDAMVPAYFDAHSWLFTTPGLARDLDHPSLTAGRARHHQLVIYAEDDNLFPPQGMLTADRELTEHFHYGPGTYQALFLPGPHRFDHEMQTAVKNFFANHLAAE
jgi:hypothetical protein